MESLRLAWQLFRLARFLTKNRVEGASASVTLLQEKRESVSYQEMRAQAKALGVPVPPPRLGAEVGVWLDVGAPHTVYNGYTIRHALERALKGA